MSLQPRFDEHLFANGLKVIGEYNQGARSVAAGYFVKTGSRDESEELAGVSHFLEHMMFKGTLRRSPEDINREFDVLGANYNAFTSDENTVYHGAVLPERLPGMLDLFSDMMRPALREADFEAEKKVILEEIAMYEDRPQFKVFEEGNLLYYGKHPMANAVLGTPASISALSRQQMLDYFEARYAPNNLLLALSGAYDWDAVLSQVEALTASWRSRPSERLYPELTPFAGSEVLASEQLSRVHLALYAPGVSAQSPLRYGAALLANCIGDSVGSRLYWALVDKGLAEGASLSHDAADGLGTYVGYVSMAAEQKQQVLDTLAAELDKVQVSGNLSKDEWSRAQRKLATGLTLRGETPYGRLMSLGMRWQYGAVYESVTDTVNAIMASSLDEATVLLEQRPFDRMLYFSMEPAAS